MAGEKISLKYSELNLTEILVAVEIRDLKKITDSTQMHLMNKESQKRAGMKFRCIRKKFVCVYIG